MTDATNESPFSFIRLLVVIMVTLSVVMGLVSMAALWLGKEIARSGHSADGSLREIIVGNDVLQIPANYIRFRSQRRAATAERLDLYFHWPSAEGFSEQRRDDFNQPGSRADLVFITLETRGLPLDMSARLGSIYQALFEGMPRRGPSGLVIQGLRADAGFDGEELYFQPDVTPPYVVRCSNKAQTNAAANCMRDFHAGKGLTITYRFPLRHISQWRAIEDTVRNLMRRFLTE